MKKTHNNSLYFLGIDVGSSSCKGVLSVVTSWESLDIEILAVVEIDTDNSVERGSIVNMDKASGVIRAVFEELQQKENIPDGSHIYGSFSIEDKDVTSRINKARYPFSKYPREITHDDLYKAREMASNFPLQNGKEYLHIMTRHYRVDERLPKRNPESELGLSLEAELFLVSVHKQEIVKYDQCSKKMQIPMNYICAAPIAAGEAVLTKLEKEQTTVLIDIGAQTTSGIVFDGGVPKVLSVIPLGSNDVTRDISRVTHVPYQLAETLKKQFTCVDTMYFSQLTESITTHEEEYDQTFTIKTQDLYKIAYARMYELFKLLYSYLHIADIAHVYPVVLTGGGSRIVGCKQMVEKLTGSKIRMAQPWNWGGPVSEYRTPSFSISVGLCVAAARNYKSMLHAKNNGDGVHITQDAKSSSIKNFFTSIGNSMKRFFSFGEIE